MDRETALFYSLIVIIWSKYLWDTFIYFLELHAIGSLAMVPKILQGVYTPNIFLDCRSIATNYFVYKIITSLLITVLQTAIVLYNVLPLIWNYCQTITKNQSNKIYSVWFYIMILYISEFVISFFFDIIESFIIFGNQKIGGFLITTFVFKFLPDIPKSFILLSMILSIIEKGGQYFLLYLWLFGLIASTIAQTTSLLVWPLFEPCESLDDHDLKSMIMNLSVSVSFQMSQICVEEVSEQTDAWNAHAKSILGAIRIGIYDTLLTSDMTNEEIVGIVGHELGHIESNDLLSMFLFDQVVYSFRFLLGSLLYYTVVTNNLLYVSLKFDLDDAQPVILGLISIFGPIVLKLKFFPYYLMPYDTVIAFMRNSWLQVDEYYADAFSAALGYGEYLHSALIKLEAHNRNFPAHNWLASKYLFEHPALLERLDELPRLDNNP